MIGTHRWVDEDTIVEAFSQNSFNATFGESAPSNEEVARNPNNPFFVGAVVHSEVAKQNGAKWDHNGEFHDCDLEAGRDFLFPLGSLGIMILHRSHQFYSVAIEIANNRTPAPL